MIALNEPLAVLDPGDGSLAAAGAIRAFFSGVIATNRKFEFGAQQPAVVSGDLALISTVLLDGSVTAEVARRQSDGAWLCVIDRFVISAVQRRKDAF
jgi:ketosteroid isomerase-like protein